MVKTGSPKVRGSLAVNSLSEVTISVTSLQGEGFRMPKGKKSLLCGLTLLLAFGSSSVWAEHGTSEAKGTERLAAPTVCPSDSALDRYLDFFDRLIQEATLVLDQADKSKAKKLEAKIEELTKLNAGLEQRIEEAKECEKNLRGKLASAESSIEFYKKEQVRRSIEVAELSKASKTGSLSTEQFFTDLAKAVNVGYWSHPGAPSIKSATAAQTVLNKYPAWWVLSKLKDISDTRLTTEDNINVLRAFYLYHSALRIGSGAPNADGTVQVSSYERLPVNLEQSRYQYHTDQNVFILQNKNLSRVYSPHYERMSYEDAIARQSRDIIQTIRSEEIVVSIDDPLVQSGMGLLGSGEFGRVVRYASVFSANEKPKKLQIQLQKQGSDHPIPKMNWNEWSWDEKAPYLELAIP
jgi:hypothetical protein